jgi:hypothetical protein
MNNSANGSSPQGSDALPRRWHARLLTAVRPTIPAVIARVAAHLPVLMSLMSLQVSTVTGAPHPASLASGGSTTIECGLLAAPGACATWDSSMPPNN